MSLDFEQARFFMVNQQVRTWDVLDPHVLDVLGRIKREDFVPPRYRRMAFTDMALPLEHGEVMMKPAVEGRMLQALDISPEDEVLEIGTGSGFISACLAKLARDVTSIDIHADFIERAHARTKALGIINLTLEVADALQYQADRRFDAIAVTAAVAEVPEIFQSWLKPGGRLFVVRGHSPVQQAVLLRASADNRVSAEGLFETDLPYLIGSAPIAQFAL